MQKKIKIVLSLIVLYACQLGAQKQIHINIQPSIHLSTNKDILPLYQYSNQWGIVSPFQQTQALTLVRTKYNFLKKKNVSLELGVSAVGKNDIDDSFLHEAYLKGQFWETIDFSIGKQAYTPVSVNDRLTTGGFMMNSNARPVPKIIIGIYDYWPVSFLNEKVEIKGGITQGILDDDRTVSGKSNSADDLLVHEKWLYVKVPLKNVQPYAGIFHGALFGGTRSDGKKIPVDYFLTVTARGGGEETNAVGAHDGFWDVGFFTENNVGNFQFYYQLPFADGSGLKLQQFRNKDYKIGVYAQLKNLNILKNISLELIKTDYQSGAGIPDALYPTGSDRAGQIIWMGQIDNFDDFMLKYYGKRTNGWSEDKVWDFLEREENHGNKFGGRDNYNNNGTYYNGWTYHQLPMGLPLYHTIWQAKVYAPGWTPNNHGAFVNNRVKGFHIGLEGAMAENISYLFKSTYTLNKGTYAEQYIKRYSWEEQPGFFYKGGKEQVYSYFSLKYQNKKWKSINIQGSISYDFGDLYDAFGCMLGINYSPSINF